MFVVLTADSWESTRQLGKELVGWAFRGQENSSWELSTTLNRAAERFLHPTDLLFNREVWLLREFQRRAHHYVNDAPSIDQKLEWLALIQHYGGPTRLLDFSHSFYVAMFFAIERASADAAVWAINLRVVEDFLKAKMNLDPQQTSQETIYETNARHVELAETFIGIEKHDKMILGVEPNRMNERLSIQQGLFFFPCDITCSFGENLAATIGCSPDVLQTQLETQYSPRDHNCDTLAQMSLIKIMIPRRCHREIIFDLQEMNVTSATLYPGLDGFARSLYYGLRGLDLGLYESER